MYIFIYIRPSVAILAQAAELLPMPRLGSRPPTPSGDLFANFIPGSTVNFFLFGLFGVFLLGLFVPIVSAVSLFSFCPHIHSFYHYKATLCQAIIVSLLIYTFCLPKMRLQLDAGKQSKQRNSPEEADDSARGIDNELSTDFFAEFRQ